MPNEEGKKGVGVNLTHRICIYCLPHVTRETMNIKMYQRKNKSSLGISKIDPTFVIDEDENFDAQNVDDHNDDNCDESSSLIQTKKFIVFENCLDDILNCLICNICKCHVDPSDTIKEYCGSMLKVSVFCTGGHLVKKWLSQPLLGKMPVANLLVCAATLFAGQTYAHISQFAKFMNLQFVSKTTFQTVQREIVMPVVDRSCVYCFRGQCLLSSFFVFFH